MQEFFDDTDARDICWHGIDIGRRPHTDGTTTYVYSINRTFFRLSDHPPVAVILEAEAARRRPAIAARHAAIQNAHNQTKLATKRALATALDEFIAAH